MDAASVVLKEGSVKGIFKAFGWAVECAYQCKLDFTWSATVGIVWEQIGASLAPHSCMDFTYTLAAKNFFNFFKGYGTIWDTLHLPTHAIDFICLHATAYPNHIPDSFHLFIPIF